MPATVTAAPKPSAVRSRSGFASHAPAKQAATARKEPVTAPTRSVAQALPSFARRDLERKNDPDPKEKFADKPPAQNSASLTSPRTFSQNSAPAITSKPLATISAPILVEKAKAQVIEKAVVEKRAEQSKAASQRFKPSEPKTTVALPSSFLSARAPAASTLVKTAGANTLSGASPKPKAPIADKPKATSVATAKPRAAAMASPAPKAAATPKSTPKLAPLGPSKAPSQGGGQPLPAHIQDAIQNSFMMDLSPVRLHSDAGAERKAQSIRARAFTYGNDIFLGRGEHPTDLTLLSHEAAHVIQQQAGAQPQAWSADRSDRFEREADSAAAAVVRRESFPVRERTESPRVQRLGIGAALDYIADKANNIPGFRMFTVVLGVNPINMEHVDRTPANVLRAVVEFIPGGHLITQALDQYGVFDKVGAWVSDQLETLAMTGSAIKQALMDFLHSLSLSDIIHPGDVWDRAKKIFTDPIERIKNFVVGLLEGIWKFVREAILKPVAKLAEGSAGWDLLIAVLGKNPITGEAVERTPEKLIGGFMKLIHEDEIWENIQKSGAIPRAWAWFQGVLSGLMGFVSQIPGLFIQALKTLDWTDIINLPGGFLKVAGVFGKFLGNFITWAGGKVWDMLQIIFDVVAPAVMPYLKKVGAAFKKILKDPLSFVMHLVDAAKLGLNNFMGNFGEHLKKALIDWLTGSLPGVYIPKAFTLPEFGMFAMSVLGVTWAQIRAKIVKALGPNGEMIMSGLEGAFDVVMALIHGGPAAAWDLIKEKLTNLKDTLIDGIVGFVTDTILKKAIPKLISMFIPGAGFISAIVSIYDTIMVFVQKLAKIAAVVKSFVDGIVNIANGQIEGAAARVESALESILSLVISFLAGFLGLGNIADKVLAVIKKVQAVVDKALDTAINWVITKAKALFARLFGGKDDKKPDERTPEQKKADLAKAIQQAKVLQDNQEESDDEVKKGLLAIKTKYKMVSLEFIVDSESETDETVHIEGVINPPDATPKTKRKKGAVYPAPEWGLYGALRAKEGADKLPDGKIREAHHAPQVQFAETLVSELSSAGKTVARQDADAGDLLKSAASALQQVTGADQLPAILVHQDTHRTQGGGSRIHGSEIRPQLDKVLKDAAGRSEIDLSAVATTAGGDTAVKPGGAAYQRAIRGHAQQVSGQKSISRALKDSGAEILDNVYNAERARALGAVDVAVSASKKDGPDDKKQSALASFRSLATATWNGFISVAKSALKG